MLYGVIFVAILVLDGLTKLWAASALEPMLRLPLWEGVFHLTYVENRGAAFGIFQDGRVFFIIITIAILVIIGIAAKRFKNRSRLLNIGLAFVSAGAVGNLIDRIFRGFVVDFFDFCLINFPVFNVADIFVCIGAVLVAVFIIFFEEENKSRRNCKNDGI